MPWIAPEITRVDEPQVGDDQALLAGRLERNRSCLLYKCSGLTGEQLAQRSVPPSTMSLLGLVRHMTEVERHCGSGAASGASGWNTRTGARTGRTLPSTTWIRCGPRRTSSV